MSFSQLPADIKTIIFECLNDDIVEYKFIDKASHEAIQTSTLYYKCCRKLALKKLRCYVCRFMDPKHRNIFKHDAMSTITISTRDTRHLRFLDFKKCTSNKTQIYSILYDSTCDLLIRKLGILNQPDAEIVSFSIILENDDLLEFSWFDRLNKKQTILLA